MRDSQQGNEENWDSVRSPHLSCYGRKIDPDRVVVGEDEIKYSNQIEGDDKKPRAGEFPR